MLGCNGVDELLTPNSTDTQFVVLHNPSALTQYVVVTVGFTTGAAPDAATVPPQDTVYHTQFADVPKLPPVILRVEDASLQIYDGPAIALVGITDKLLTTTVTEAQYVVLHVPSALTKYVVVTLGVAVKEVSVPINPAPQDVEYQFQIPFVPSEPPVNDKVVELPWHRVVDDELALIGASDNVLTVSVVLTQVVVLQAPSART